MALLLTGCAQIGPVKPPIEWLASTPEPTRRVILNKDLILLVKDYQFALSSCNADKEDVLKFIEMK